jgi:hypothetical protein
MSTILRGFEYNDSTTPAPWGPRETVWNRQMINTLSADTLTGLMDESGHKHISLYDSPTGLSYIDSTTLSGYTTIVTVETPGLTGSQESSLIMSGSAYTSSTVTLRTGASDNTHLATITMASGLGTDNITDRASIFLDTGEASIEMSGKNPSYAPYVDINAGSASVHSYPGTVDIIAGTTDTSHARIQLMGNALSSNAITMIVDSDRNRGGSITIQGGYNGGLDDVPINLFTDGNVIIGRSIYGLSNIGDLEANFGGTVTIQSHAHTVNLSGYAGVTISSPAVTMITSDASCVKNLHVDGDIYTKALTEYTASTLTGFSVTSSKSVFYTKVGKQVHVWFAFSGTSNATGMTMTLPYAATTAALPTTFLSTALVHNDSTAVVSYYTLSDSTAIFHKNPAGDSFTASGDKGASGYLTYLTA